MERSKRKNNVGMQHGIVPIVVWFFAALAALTPFLGIVACTHTQEPVYLDLMRGPLILDEKNPADDADFVSTLESSSYAADLKKQLSAIEKAAALSSEDKVRVAPVLSVLRAQIAEIDGNLALSAEFWRTALRVSPGQGRIAKMVFDHWARHLTRIAAPGADVIVVARDALASVGGGRESQYLLSQGLLTETDLARRLYPLAPDRFAPYGAPPTGLLDGSMPPATPPLYGARNVEDPLLSGVLRQACAARLPDQIAAWDVWIKPLKQPWIGYWDGMIADCSGRHGSAVEAFTAAIAQMDEGDVNEEELASLASLRVELYSRLIKARRALGERETLGPEYENLVASWRARKVSAKAMGLNPGTFMLRRIDDTLWAARQRALGDNLVGAEASAREALDLINKSYPDPVFVAPNHRRDLGNLRCEALHFRAFRVAYERRDWTQAAVLTEDALQTVPITPEWTRRLQSHAVLYDFAAGQMALARKRLEQLLSDATDDSTRAFSLFWLARVFEQMGQKTESDFYLHSLIQEQPLSYYAVIAAPSAGLLAHDAWLKNFGDLEKLRARLGAVTLTEAANIGGDKSNWDSARHLSEILVKAGSAGRWARAAVADAADAAAKASRPDRNPEAFLYLSRLAYSAGDYGRVIELTAALSSASDGFWARYPEQIFLIFPFPRLKTFAGVATTGKRMTLMLGLARQESSFRAEAQSAARAFGYMQLTAATARRLLGGQAPASDDIIETMLIDPQTSIQLSARYLDILNDQFGGSELLMAAAYNAGEHAVSGWRKRREVEDQALFIESIPYSETKGYVKAVLRNAAIYRRLLPLTRESLNGNKKEL